MVTDEFMHDFLTNLYNALFWFHICIRLKTLFSVIKHFGVIQGTYHGQTLQSLPGEFGFVPLCFCKNLKK